MNRTVIHGWWLIAGLISVMAVSLVSGWFLAHLATMPHGLIKFAEDFATSAGLGGIAAVAAATIAFLGVRHSSQTSRQSSELGQWWETARWATDHLLIAEIPERDTTAAVITLRHLVFTAPTQALETYAMDVMAEFITDDHKLDLLA